MNPNTHMLLFNRFSDLDLAAGDLVQVMGANGTAYTLSVTGAQSATWGAAFVGSPVGTASGSSPVVFQSQDVAALAPAGTQPTASAGWATSSTGLPPVLQVYNVTDASSIQIGGFVRLQDTRGGGTGIVAEVTALDPKTGSATATVTTYQGVIVPTPTLSFTAANVAYVAADGMGTPPPGAATGNYQPLTNPVFNESNAGFSIGDLAIGDIATLASLDGTTFVGAITGWSGGGVTAQEITGPQPGATILFDASEIQSVALGSAPTVFLTTPAALNAAANVGTIQPMTSAPAPAAASAGCAPAGSGALFAEQLPFAGRAPAGWSFAQGGLTPQQITAFRAAFLAQQKQQQQAAAAGQSTKSPPIRQHM